MHILILAGGKGSRLWPYSSSLLPKQFLTLKGEHSFLQKTVLRFLKQWPIEQIWILTHPSYSTEVKRQLREIDEGLVSQLLLEPEQRNTAPAVVLALKHLEERGCGKDELILLAPSDHFFPTDEPLIEAIEDCLLAAAKNWWVTFGVTPSRPETGYGYLKVKTASSPPFLWKNSLKNPKKQRLFLTSKAGSTYGILESIFFKLATFGLS